LLAAVVLIYSLFYLGAGIRFDVAPLAFYWQLVDPALLRTELWRSVLHLHSQPPLFNLFLGGVLQLPAAWQATVFRLVYLGLGLALGASLLALQARLGVGRRPRLLLTALLVCSPACVLTENQLFYTYPVMAALAASGLYLHRFLDRRRLVDGLVFFSLLAAVVLIYSLFYLGWLLSVALAVGWLAHRLRRKVAAAAALPVLLCLLWYARGYALFGSLSASSWLGMSLAQTVTRLIPPAERCGLFAEDPAEAILGVPPFSPLAAYAGRVPLPPVTGVAVLDEPFKSTGAPNFHHLAYVGIGRAYARGALALIRRHPTLYLRAVAAAHLVYFRSPADSAWLGENRRRIAGFSRWFDRLVYGQWEAFQGRFGPRCVAWVPLLLFPLLLVSAGRRAFQGLRRHDDLASSLTIAFIVFTILYVTAVGNLVELGENNRFRLLVEPFLFILFGLLLPLRSSRWTT
ncbi:MAG TPA: hypothetical protein VOA87_16935, partial [Thermoanaerobaculia bacterium]|nr:hypothetical protein [Thermoanaerobaculia bacterium]